MRNRPLFQCMIALAGFAMMAPAASAASSGSTLVRSASNPAVYLVTNGKRYAFPNERVYSGWYADFSGVKTVSDSELASYTLAGNVTAHPGTSLVKVATDPKVYAVARGQVLRWVKNEDVAKTLFGADWNTKVQDVADTMFANYTVGDPIGSADQFNADQEKGVTGFDQELDHGSSGTTPLQPQANAPTVVVTISTSHAVLGQMINVTATISNNAQSIAKIDVYNDTQVNPLFSCSAATTCSGSYTVPNAPLSTRFSAIVTDTQGATYAAPYDLQAALDVPASSSQVHMSLAPISSLAGSRVSFTSDASTLQNITSHKIYIAIPNETDPVLWKDCGTATICAASNPFYRTSQLYSTVMAGGDTFISSAATVTITGGTPPHPTLTILDRTSNRVHLRLDAPSGETIGWSALIAGTEPTDNAIALCDTATCDLTIQFTTPQTVTAFTSVGGKLEPSNSLDLKVE